MQIAKIVLWSDAYNVMMGDANIPLCNTAMLLYVWGGAAALGNGKVCNISSRQLSSKLVLICPLTK